MRSCAVLAMLSLMLAFRSCQSSCEEPDEPLGAEIKDSPNPNTLPRGFLKRFYDGFNYDGFVGLMGRRSTGMNELSPQKRDMHDFFVGLMGRRNTEAGMRSPLKRESYPESRGSLLPNKCKMRFRRGA
ncbi:tachykinin-3a isoform X2 [Lepisosteus oculatus]|uniref:tachykinin-3a isoform X2 n=1 Tax=Lepisosteus oculatus TaxID=7918 RepID=UPI00073FBB9D|nr:PREDICTED: tachykinin-3 [Lepisosteus oculatus]